ncbi:hypothetical protein MHK_003197, partial [Candidatus Magnetomorum sp. HK-1]
MIHEAKKEIEKKRKCFLFDIRDLLETKGGLYAYQKIINDLLGNVVPVESIETYIHHDFINDLNKKIRSPVVLFFDHFQATYTEFYNHFSNTCQKIHHIRENQPKKGCNQIVMVFSGTLVLKDVAD